MSPDPVSSLPITNPRYTRHHPRWYRRRMPIFWWLRKWNYAAFILRELTSLFVGYTALLLLVQVWMLGRGPEAHAAFVQWLRTPWVVALHAFVLIGLVLHAVTWLNLAPKALVIRLGERKVPDAAVAFGHYAAWAVASLLVLWVLVGGAA